MNKKTVSREQHGVRAESQGSEPDEAQLHGLEPQGPDLFRADGIVSPLQGQGEECRTHWAGT